MSSINSTLSNIFNIFMGEQQHKEEQILEPLTCIIKLGILYLKEEGTKLQIIGNSIHYHSPNMMQGTSRWLAGDNRNDLHNLSNPIKIALKWYNPHENKDVEALYKYAINGLICLGKSYDIENVSSLIGNTISHYINLMSRTLECPNANYKLQYINYQINYQINNSDVHKKNTNMKKKNHHKQQDENNQGRNQDENQKDEIQQDDDNKVIKHNQEQKNNSDPNVYKDIWTQDEISIINKLFNIALKKKTQKDNYKHYIKSIESILNDKDDKIREIIYMKTTKLQ